MMNAGYVINFYGINGTPANLPKFSGWVCQIQYPPPDFDGEAANEKGVTMRQAFLKALAHLTKRAGDTATPSDNATVLHK